MLNEENTSFSFKGFSKNIVSGRTIAYKTRKFWTNYFLVFTQIKIFIVQIHKDFILNILKIFIEGGAYIYIYIFYVIYMYVLYFLFIYFFIL